MNIPKKPKTVLILGIGLLVGIVSLLAWPKEPLDLSKEEGPFPAIHMPPQAVYGYGYMDGGSVGILIVDHVGAKHEFCFPVNDDGIRNRYPIAYSGNINDPKRVAVKDPERAKKIAIRLLDEFDKEMNHPSVDCDDCTARARRALASPPHVVAIRAYDKFRKTLGF